MDSDPETAEAERELDEAKLRWEALAEKSADEDFHSVSSLNPLRKRRARQLAAELEAARLECGRAWRALQALRPNESPSPIEDPAPAEIPPAEPESPPQREPREPDGPPALSTASFEELRELGLSVTQAMRVFQYREQNGGFTDLDELDSLPGFPPDLLEQIKQSVVP
jgi:hypothetical protein